MRKRPWMMIGLGCLGFYIVALFAAYAADEIRVKVELRVDNGNFALERTSGSQAYDQNQQAMEYHIQSIQTVPEAITVNTDVKSNGWTWLRNLTATGGHYVDIGTSNASGFLAVLRLEPGEFACGRLHTNNTIYAKAASNSVDLEVWINAD